MRPSTTHTIVFALTGLVLAAGPSWGQNRVRLPADSAPSLMPEPPTNGMPSAGTWNPVPMMPPAQLGGQIQPFDPYATPSPGAIVVPPSPYTMPPPGGTIGIPPGTLPPAPTTAPPAAPWNFPQPTLPPTTAQPWPGGSVVTPPVPPPGYYPLPGGGVAPPSPYGQPLYGTPGVPTTVYPPPTYPAPGISTPGPPAVPGQPGVVPVFPQGIAGPAERLFQDTGGVYTYLYGSDGPQLEIHEVEIFSTLLFKYFDLSDYGFRLMPGFVFDFLNGPSDVDADMPPQLYAAYLDASMKPQFTPQFGAELSVRTGVYSDFDTVTSQSIRITGVGLGVLQLTPTTALKLGVEYIDRVDLKLLPAVGILYVPDPRTRWDFYFPRPKFSRYLTTNGNTDIWWLIGAEYGGGSWTIDRADAPLAGMSDRVDINDIRIYTGIDWERLNAIGGTLQFGYVFDRELVYDLVPQESLGLDDTFMVRLGLQF